MRNFILSILLVTSGLTSAFAQSDQANFDEALASLKTGDIDKAYSQLESLGPDSPLFVPALVELQKLNFKGEKWDQFFAYAVFYREKLLKNQTIGDAHYVSRMLSLETSALIKHCFYEEAKAVSELGPAISKLADSSSNSNSDSKQTLGKAMYLSGLMKGPQSILKQPKQNNFPATFFSGKFYWPIAEETLESVEHPRILRLKIKSRCTAEMPAPAATTAPVPAPIK